MAVNLYEQHRPREATVTVSQGDPTQNQDYSGDFICDGTNDDVEILAALAYVGTFGGGEVFLKEGTYAVDGLVYPLPIFSVTVDNLLLRGAGWNTIIRLNDNSTAVNEGAVIFSINADNVTIANLQIDGNWHNNAPIDPATDGANITVVSTSENFVLYNVLSIMATGDGVETGGERSIIIENHFIDSWEHGIHFNRAKDSIAVGNIVREETNDALISVWCAEGEITKGIIIADNRLYDGHTNGISLVVEGTARDIIVANNIIDNCTGNGIYVRSERTRILGNIVRDCDSGLFMDGGSRVTISDNEFSHNQLQGIRVTAASNIDNLKIHSNDIYENSQDTISTYPGIKIDLASNDITNIWIDWNNIISITADQHRYGIQITDSVGGGSLTRCYVRHNHIEDTLWQGINDELGATIIRKNRLIGTTGVIIQTDTIVEELPVYIIDPDTNLGTHPAVNLPDEADTTIRFQIQIPLEFQMLVTAQIIVAQTVTVASPDMQWSTVTNFGKLCADQAYNVRSDAETDQVTAITQNDLECIDVSASLDGILAGDLVGFEFVRRATQAGDEIDGAAYFLGFRLRYV